MTIPDRLRTRAYLAAWQAMREKMPLEHWSVPACDAVADAVLRTVKDDSAESSPA